jgi:hypothetical protein
LIFLMITNAITGVIILPSFVSAFRPYFIRRFITNDKDQQQPYRAASST